MSKKIRFALSLLAVAGTASAAQVFPQEKWEDLKVVRTEKALRVENAKGKALFRFAINPSTGDLLKHVVVTQGVEGLCIDAHAAFDAGAISLMMHGPAFDLTGLDGRDCSLVVDVKAPDDAYMASLVSGRDKVNKHYWRARKIRGTGTMRDYQQVESLPEGLRSLGLRFDISNPGKATAGPVIFRKATFGSIEEIPVKGAKRSYQSELVFYQPFDGTLEAAFAKGDAKPVVAKNVDFAEGVKGMAARFTRELRSSLAYATKGNLDSRRGTVSFWLKREWHGDGGFTDQKKPKWRQMIAHPDLPKDVELEGSGRIRFWHYGSYIRSDQRDADRKGISAYHRIDQDRLEEWAHIAITWDEFGTRVFYNGKGAHDLPDSYSPMRDARTIRDEMRFDYYPFDRFFVGGLNGRDQIDGLIDELRIYSAPLSQEEIVKLYHEGVTLTLEGFGTYALEGRPNEVLVMAKSPARADLTHLRYCVRDAEGKVIRTLDSPVTEGATKLTLDLPKGTYVVSATDGKAFFGELQYVVFPRGNAYERPGETASVVFSLRESLELVEEVKFGELPSTNRFRSVGKVSFGSLDGVRYLEAGQNECDRFAVRFTLDRGVPLYCFEIDYPDDKERTADIIVQSARHPRNDYTLQCGVAAGAEYPNTGKVLTHRCLYWTRDEDVAVIMMTARAKKPAAVSAIRVYRVKDGALPSLSVKPVPGDIPNRSFALYFEDPAIGYDFATGDSAGRKPDELNALIDRTAALMKFTGEDVLAYPAAFYNGIIRDGYNPRRHAPDFLSAWYARFDEEGLSFIPTLNVNNMPVPDGLVTRQSMSDGSLHDSPISILNTGKPNVDGWHGTPPYFNITHPQVQGYIEGMIDRVVEQGVKHKSFKGVALHVAEVTLFWFGDETSGYNDYTVQAFAKEKGLSIPVSRTDPLRGKAYYEWLRQHAWEDWIQWRCDQVTKFYVRLADKLKAARPDLKLWLNNYYTQNIRHPDYLSDTFMAQATRYGGFDVKGLRRAANLILSPTVYPADFRKKGLSGPLDAVMTKHRIDNTLADYYAMIERARMPWVHQHDRYWECDIGKGGRKGSVNSLSCEWLNEATWRVSTINPSGTHALRHFVLPLRYGDVLGVSKGGFLIGTYGMEEALAPFIRQFRSLPAVVFDEVKGAADDVVRVREKDVAGRYYFYVVNTDLKPVTVKLVVPPETQGLVTGERLADASGSKELELSLGPYELRGFVAPKGAVRWLRKGMKE